MEDWKSIVFIDVFHVKRSPEGTNFSKEPEMHTTQNGWLAPRISKNSRADIMQKKQHVNPRASYIEDWVVLHMLLDVVL